MQDPDLDKFSFLLELYRKGLNLPEKILYEYFLDHAVKSTKSASGFFHLVSDDQESIILTSWNREALKNCTANYATHYPVSKAGNWADCLRLKRPIIYNDFAESPNQKGLPEGHVAVRRMLSFPIMEEGKVKAIFGVGNKTEPYVKGDVVQLELVANELNKILKHRKIEADLREAKEKYYSLFANMLDGFAYCEMIFDNEEKPVDFVYLEVNDAFERLTGLKRENIVGRKVSEAIPGTREANPEIFDIYGRVAQTGNPERFELFFKPLSIWLDIAVYSPKRGYFVAIFANITERKKAEEDVKSSEKRYRRLFETSQDGIVARDLKGNMIDCNQAYCKMLGYSKQELKNLSANDILPEKWKEHREKIVNRILETGGSVVFEREYIRKDGTIFPASVRTWRVTDDKGKATGTWSIVRDITAQKELQEKLEEYNENLERTVEERTNQLRDAERLAAIGATAGMVGHDIRNPLQAIMNDIFLAKSDLSVIPEGKEKDGIKESLDYIENNVGYINKIVLDLQDYARSLKPVMQETRLDELCKECTLRREIPDDIEASCEVAADAEKLAADPAMLRRIISNLVSNAVQAMPKGGKLCVRAFRDADDTVITVQDTGIGIPEEARPKLFTPLFTTKAKGQGFGLAVVKRMTEALGGTITFESQNGKGTTFVVRFPQSKK